MLNPRDIATSLLPGYAAYQTGKAADKYFFKKPAQDAKAAYDQAAGMSQENLAGLMKYIGGQQDQALGYYKPLQTMFNNAYGTQGIAAPQTPRAPGAK